MVKSYSIHAPKSKKREAVLFREYSSWAAKHYVLFADFDYETPAIGLPNRNKVYLDCLLPADKSQRNKEKRKRETVWI